MPWLAQVQVLSSEEQDSTGFFFNACSGSLIAPNVVVTSARCFISFQFRGQSPLPADAVRVAFGALAPLSLSPAPP